MPSESLARSLLLDLFPNASIRWIAVNNRRVDALIFDATPENKKSATEKRATFFIDKNEQPHCIEIHSEPDSFEGVPGGVIVVLNGPSSSGKSGVMTAMQELSENPWVLFDEPHLGSVPGNRLIWRERSMPIHRGFLAGIVAVARAGNYVAVVAAAHPFDLIRELTADTPTLLVGLDCDVGTLQDRESARIDRRGGLAQSESEIHDGWAYDLRLDSAVLSAEQIARQILEAVGSMRSQRPTSGSSNAQ